MWNVGGTDCWLSSCIEHIFDCAPLQLVWIFAAPLFCRIVKIHVVFVYAEFGVRPWWCVAVRCVFGWCTRSRILELCLYRKPHIGLPFITLVVSVPKLSTIRMCNNFCGDSYDLWENEVNHAKISCPRRFLEKNSSINRYHVDKIHRCMHEFDEPACAWASGVGLWKSA